MTGSIVFYSHSKQDIPKPEQVNVSEEKADDKVANDVESKENKEIEDKVILDQKQEEVKEKNQEVKSDSNYKNNNVSSASKTEIKQENKQSSSAEKSVSKETPKENPKTNNNQSQSSNNTNTQQPKTNVSTKLYESITGGKKEFSSDSEATARGTEIQNKELDYVLDYNEQHPEAPIQPEINYFRVYPSVIDENGKTWYYLHFFCVSGEGQDAKLKSKY